MTNLREDGDVPATEYGKDRSELREAVRAHFKTEIGIERDRLAMLGWDGANIDAAINVYLDHRCELHAHAVGIIAINVYLQALVDGRSVEDAYALAIQVKDIADAGVAKRSSSGEGEEIPATVVVSDHTFGTERERAADEAVEETVQLDLSRIKASFQLPINPDIPQGFDAFNPATWKGLEDVRTKDVSAVVASVRKRLATVTVDRPVQGVAQVAVVSPAATSASDATVVEAAVHSAKLIEEEIHKQGMAVFGVLVDPKRYNYGTELAGDGALFYAKKVRNGLPGTMAWDQTLIYCTQRKRGAGKEQAELIADKKMGEIPERNEAVAPVVEDEMRREMEQREKTRSRLKWALAISVGVTLAGLGIGVAYHFSHTDQSAIESNDGGNE